MSWAELVDHQWQSAVDELVPASTSTSSWRSIATPSVAVGRPTNWLSPALTRSPVTVSEDVALETCSTPLLIDLIWFVASESFSLRDIIAPFHTKSDAKLKFYVTIYDVSQLSSLSMYMTISLATVSRLARYFFLEAQSLGLGRRTFDQSGRGFDSRPGLYQVTRSTQPTIPSGVCKLSTSLTG